MNKSVPTLLGILIILVVAVLIVLVYNIKLTQQLGTGATPTGTYGGQILTGEKAPTTMLPPAGPGKGRPETVTPAGRRGERGPRPGAGNRRGEPGNRGGEAGEPERQGR
ncbi:MAG: hypothetical protein ABSD48_03315 [Armatimonadota bacterium]|jgi:hypothetical protein